MSGGRRTSIAEQLAQTATGNDVDAAKRTVRPRAEVTPEDGQSSRQSDGKTSSLPSLPAVSHFVAPASDDPAVRLSYCESAIADAERATAMATEVITQQYLLWVGEPYRIVRDEELYRLAGYSTFDAWCRAHGRSGDYMNKVIRVAPVVRALAVITRRQLKELTLRPLVSVQRDHGDEAVRACWVAAEEAGDLTERGLLAAAVRHGYKVQLDPAPLPAADGDRPALDPAQVSSLSLGKVRSLAATDPGEALALCVAMREEIKRLERTIRRTSTGA